MEEITSYHYQPLQHSDSIRILVLHPSPNESDPITCTIRHIRLSEAAFSLDASSIEDFVLQCRKRFEPFSEVPAWETIRSLEETILTYTSRLSQLSNDFVKYEAVSYTWGDSTQKNIINFQGGREKLAVGHNCHAALRRLRLAHADRTVWIDAICINQNDLQERAQQVCIMNDVYSRASGVMVMLNDSIPDCCLLQDELAEVAKLLNVGKKIVRPPPSEAIVRQLETLFEDPWFRRTWILQEVHGKESVTIVYGPAIIPFEALMKLYFGYDRIMVTRSFWPRPLELIHRHGMEYSTTQFNLWYQLYASRACLATDPRDKVFALKSLIGSRGSEIDYLIDYVQSVEHCYQGVATYLLPVLGLRILSATRHPHETDMASWIPDWSSTSALQFSAFSFESDEAMAAGDSSIPATDEDHELTLQSYSHQELSTGLELHVVGYQHARIIECSQNFHFDDIYDAEKQMVNIYNEFDNIRQHLDVETRHDVPITSNQFSSKTFDIMSQMDGIKLHYSLTRGYGRINDPIRPQKDIENFHDALQSCNISLLQTGELTIVPGAARPGDVICLLSGAVAPCLLRPDQDERWTLVSGDCYIFLRSLDTAADMEEYVELYQDKAEHFLLR